MKLRFYERGEKKNSHEVTDYIPLMLIRYAKAPQGQCEVRCKALEIPNASDTLICFYPCIFLKCMQIRAHQLFMP